MSVLSIADSFYIGVLDLAAATAGYSEKLGLQKVPLRMDDAEGCIALGFAKKDQACITLGPRVPTDGMTAMLYASKADTAREALSSRGVIVGEIQTDRQGTHFFEMRTWKTTGLKSPRNLSRIARRMCLPQLFAQHIGKSIFRLIRPLAAQRRRPSILSSDSNRCWSFRDAR